MSEEKNPNVPEQEPSLDKPEAEPSLDKEDAKGLNRRKFLGQAGAAAAMAAGALAGSSMAAAQSSSSASGLPDETILDEAVGQMVARLPNGTEYRRVLKNTMEGEKHITPDGRLWTAVREEVVEGVVTSTPSSLVWILGATALRPVIFNFQPAKFEVVTTSEGLREWERAMRFQVGLYAELNNLVGIESTTFSGSPPIWDD